MYVIFILKLRRFTFAVCNPIFKSNTMKMKISIPVLFFVALSIFSCSKDKVTDPEQPGSALFTKMTQGLIPGDDTVFVFNYDAVKRIKNIVNSSWNDTLEATYSAAGLLSAVAGRGESGSPKFSFSYNANNQLTEIRFVTGPYRTRYTFEYTNGVISKKNFYQNSNDNADPTLYTYSTYQVTNGNISSIKHYRADGNTYLSEETFTYNNESNVFRAMSLINCMNDLGASDIADIDMFFNKNLPTAATVTSSFGSGTATINYTYNDKKQLTKTVFTGSSYIHTWQFAY